MDKPHSSRQSAKTQEEDLARLLSRAIREPTDSALFDWYKALANACPLWSRQQKDYTERWGPQTTELRPLTPWRVMSALLEREEQGPSSDVARARIRLEYIGQLDAPSEFRDPDVLLRLLRERQSQNLQEVAGAVSAIEPFLRGGVRREDVGALRDLVFHGRPSGKSGKKPLLFPEELRELGRDAEAWIGALQNYARGEVACPYGARAVGVALPFLDRVERAFVLRLHDQDFGEDWRWVSACVLHRRLALQSFGNESAKRLRGVLQTCFGGVAADLYRLVGGNPLLVIARE